MFTPAGANQALVGSPAGRSESSSVSGFFYRSLEGGGSAEVEVNHPLPSCLDLENVSTCTNWHDPSAGIITDFVQD